MGGYYLFKYTNHQLKSILGEKTQEQEITDLSRPVPSPKNVAKYTYTIKGDGDTKKIKDPVNLEFKAPKKDDNTKYEVDDPYGKQADVDINLNAGDTKKIEIATKTSVGNKPGKYTIKSIDSASGEIIESQDFIWGVLTFNPDYVVYPQNSPALLSMAVLDDAGKTICDAGLLLKITNPQGKITQLGTGDGTINVNEECWRYQEETRADYTASYTPVEAGTYNVELIAIINDVKRTLTDSFTVEPDSKIYIKRTAPTRTWPGAYYDSMLDVKTIESGHYKVTEKIPASFDVIKASFGNSEFTSVISGETNTLTWEFNTNAGDNTQLTYRFQTPSIYPYIFKLGPAEVLNVDNSTNWIEPRQWLIASDATCTSQATGNWNTSGTWDCGHVPTTSDTVVIADTYTVTIDSAPNSVISVTINSGGVLDASAATLTIGNTAAAGTAITNGGTFTPGTSSVVISPNNSITTTSGSFTFNNLQLTPALSGGAKTYTFGSSEITINGNFDIKPTAGAGSQSLAVNMGANITVTGTTTIQPDATNTPTATVDTTSANHYQLSTGILAIATRGTLTANSSDIIISGTGAAYTNSGTYTYGTSKVSYTNGTSATILAQTGTGGTNGYYNLDTNGAGTYTLGGATIVNNNLSITQGIINTGTNYALTITGSYSNAGTFTANSSTVTFNSTASGKTLSGRLNNATTNSAFYKVVFNGTGGEWTIQDPMLISAANATDDLTISAGTVTVGNGNSDGLEVAGRTLIANTANQTATLQTMSSLAAGSNVYLDINNQAAPANCSNCYVLVGATSGSGQGTLKINSNGILRLNSDNTNSDTYIQTESTGKFWMLGSLDQADTLSTGATDTVLTDALQAWTPDAHIGKYLRITTGLAKGLIYPITDNDGTTLTYTGTQSADFTETISGSGNTRKVCTSSNTLITANNQWNARYIQDKDSTSVYFLIISSINNDATCASSNDSFTVVPTPGAFASLGTGHNANVSDGLIAGDHYEIEQLAHMTAKSGLACSDSVNQTKAPYYYAKAGSENIIKYAQACNLGRNSGNLLGLNFVGIDGANANEGITLDYFYTHHNLAGIVFGWPAKNNNSTYSKGITNCTVSYNTSNGIYLQANSNSITSNTVISNSVNGIYLYGSSNNYVTSNIVSGNKGSVGWGGNILVTSSVGNVLSSNIANSITQSSIQVGWSSKNHIIKSNTTIGCTTGIELYGTPYYNVVDSNTAYYNSIGITLGSTSSFNTLMNNNSYNNSNGLYVDTSIGNISINDNYGGLGQNTIDINIRYHVAGSLTLYNTNLASTSKVATSWGPVDAAYSQFLISKKYNTTAGSTKIWGGYNTPIAVSETPQSEENDKYNYTDNLWEKSATAHGYGGTGTEDTNLDYDLSSADLSSGPYAYQAIATSATTFKVYRNGTDVGTATKGTLFTDTNASVNVSFKIDGGSPTGYVANDNYAFVVWDASGDTNTTKATQVQQNNDTYTVTAATTTSYNGGSSNRSTLSALTGSFDLTNNGTINGGYNDITTGGTFAGSGTYSMTTGSIVENRVAAAKNFGSTSGSNNWTFDTLTFSDSTSTAYTVTAASGGSGQIIVSTALNVGKTSDSKVTTFDDNANNRILNIDGSVTIAKSGVQSRGTLKAPPTAAFSIAGDFNSNGSFINDGGTVTIDGSGTSTISNGSAGVVELAFNNFTCITPGKTVQFQRQSGGMPYFSFSGTFTLTGDPGSYINLQSDLPGTQWYPYFSTQQTTVSYTNIKDSGGSGGTATVINLGTCNNVSGNNTAVWIFNTLPVNDSLTFTNPYGGAGNTAVADDTTSWQFQAKVTDADGPTNIDYIELGFANSTDSTQPYNSLRFRWTENTNTFSEVADTQDAATITSTGADSSSAGNQWTLNFKIKINSNFTTKDTQYAAELYSLDDASGSDTDNYTNIYQVTVLSLSLDVDSATISFGGLLPGSVLTSTTVATVSTNYPNGYALAINDNIAGTDSALLHTDLLTRIADYASLIASPTTWSGNGLGICVYIATGKNTTQWGAGTTETDLLNKYAGVPENTTTIHSKTGSPTSNDQTSIGYKVQVPNNQKTGDYSGDVTYTATGSLN
jgi:parallel beta-helix repeat protein